MNNKNTPSISSLLNRPHFSAGQSEVPPADPVIPTRIIATLDQVIAYKDNPRHIQNPMYDEIKESIRNRGLDHAPNVTRKHPADPYMIKDGGNTRLKILRELWEETGEEKYYRLDLMFHPWTSDIDVLIGHMIENEMRGNLIFIERAIAARKIKAQIEMSEAINVSTRELARRITEQGWSLDQAHLGQMLYAEEYLFPIIPNAFWAGVGRDTVKKIRRLLEACRSYWDSVSNVNEGEFEKIWKSVFAKLDGDRFDVAIAEYQLCGEMAQRLDGPVLSVTAQIQGILEGVKNIELVRPRHFEPLMPASNPQKIGIDKNKESSGTPRNLQLNTQETAINRSDSVRQQPGRHVTAGHATGVAQTPELSQKITTADFSPIDLMDHQLGIRKYSLSELPGGSPVLYSGYVTHTTQYLQERALEVATAYASHFGLAHNILSTLGETEKHIGFWVSSEGFASMPEHQRMHWVLLSIYALIRHEHRAVILLENMARALGGEIDTLQSVNLLMAAAHARTSLLGERARDESEFSKMVWEELTELEAIAATLLTRTYEESRAIDEIPDQSFIDPNIGQGVNHNER